MFYILEIKQPSGPHMWTTPVIKTPLRGPENEVLQFSTWDAAFSVKWALEHSPNRPKHVIYNVERVPPFLIMLPQEEDENA